MTTFIKRGAKPQVKASKAFKHPLDQMPISRLGYLSPRSKRTGPSTPHLEEFCLCSATGPTYVPCDLLSSADMWVAWKSFKAIPDLGPPAETIAVLHALTRTGAQTVLKTIYSLTTVRLRAWQDIEP